MLKRFVRRWFGKRCGAYWLHHYHIEAIPKNDMPYDPHCYAPESFGTVQCGVCCRCGQLDGYPAGVTV